MLDKSRMVGFVPTTDYEAAREFYVGKLGFTFVSLDQLALVVMAGKQRIRITKMPNYSPLQGTILGWEVEKIEDVVKWLAQRGVVTEKYPFVEDKEFGIWKAPSGAKVAWFKDPDGNILGISQHP